MSGAHVATGAGAATEAGARATEAAVAAIRTLGLSVGYRGDVVVQGIDLEVRAGSSLALVGTNGSGKSTLIKTLVGLIPAAGGSVEVLGGVPGSAPGRRRHGWGPGRDADGACLTGRRCRGLQRARPHRGPPRTSPSIGESLQFQ